MRDCEQELSSAPEYDEKTVYVGRKRLKQKERGGRRYKRTVLECTVFKEARTRRRPRRHLTRLDFLFDVVPPARPSSLYSGTKKEHIEHSAGGAEPGRGEPKRERHLKQSVTHHFTCAHYVTSEKQSPDRTARGEVTT